MRSKNLTPEQIILKLRDIELEHSKGVNILQACRNAGISDHTYYKWRREYGGMRIDQAKRYKELESENTRLKKLVADLSLDNAILKEVTRGNF